ncbi:RimJ/RimL family protein N-acetyltransferase [Hypnocyclicus thermotrophus]|uniref:RimJ/RimL family protein N-acetyltransferase n=1 Tax=Hypnocyclicus thermotrophus TaxID=1627895 RepID=A0AA46I4Q0_9FUSO|nr:GNAT family N-acetyltransferase [Hypnocyclicus thermotrophus]TDT67344.1 RimJ/RimL family protein N-acetyltransferase [Hypnocyclicus thermotrophus]
MNKNNFIFESKRCIVRNFIEKDIDEFIKYRNNLEWMKYQDYKGLTKEQYIKDLLPKKHLKFGVQLAIINKETNTLIGDIFLLQEKKSFWLGYTINPNYQKKGYISEVVISCIDWIFSKGNYRIMANVHKDNTPSINLLEKLNFKKIKEKTEEYIYQYKKD